MKTKEKSEHRGNRRRSESRPQRIFRIFPPYFSADLSIPPFLIVRYFQEGPDAIFSHLIDEFEFHQISHSKRWKKSRDGPPFGPFDKK